MLVLTTSWCVPPTKPGIIRVVFGCSVQYANMSINTELMSGPDFPNQIIGVLLRFWKEHVAFMTEIKSMFYQVLVPPQQRNILPYLWWEESSLSKEVVDYQMCTRIWWSFIPKLLKFCIEESSNRQQ